MAKTYEFDWIGYSPEYGTTDRILADNKDHAEFKALEYIKEFYPELQDVALTTTRVLD